MVLSVINLFKIHLFWSGLPRTFKSLFFCQKGESVALFLCLKNIKGKLFETVVLFVCICDGL